MTDRGTVRMKPRPRIRIRAVASLVALIVGVAAVVYGVFGWHVRRSLDSDIESLRAAGERILPLDFAPTDSSPRHNAAPDLIAAAAIVNDDSEEAWSISWAPITRPVDSRAWPYLARAKVWFEPALVRIERARQKPICQWSHRLDSPVIGMVVPELDRARSLSNLVGTAVMVEHRDGRHDLVPLRFRQALYLADVCESTPAFVAHKVALGITFSATERVESLAPDLRIETGGADAGAASRSDVRGLIAALLDEKTVEAGFRLAVNSHRMHQRDALDYLARGPNPASGYVFRPFVEVSARRDLDHLTRMVTAVRAKNDWPTVAAALERVGVVQRTRLHPFVFDSSASFRRLPKEHFQVLTDRRLAATALAIRLYQSDHAGQRPSRLEELVPDYLPTVPLDAMAAGSQPIRYRPSPDRPALYSVGLNGTDQLGDESAMPGEYGYLDAWDRMDRVFYLGGQTREAIYVAPADGRPVHVVGYGGGAPWEEVEPGDPAAPPGEI